uniref:Uncharacterized protein n=1 Tax=Sander lucioperca TaxID=283035 RepID=A0A8C9ZQC6_SANLU
MFSFKELLSAVALALLVVAVESSTDGELNRNYDMSLSQLITLYSTPVFKAERMKRPLEGTSFVLGPISHSGVRVTLGDGSQWLIHKGDNYGISSQTVVTSADNMSSDWTVVQTVDFQGTKKVLDFVRDGGSEYSLIFDNCHLAAQRMMNP